MATPRLAKRLSALQQSPKARLLRRRDRESRRLHLENLEDRRMMAVGPSLVAIVSNNGDFLDPGDTLNIAPRDLTFRFSQGAAISAPTIPNGFQLVRAGGDDIFGNANDVVVAPGFLGINDVPREVVMRFAATLPDDTYRVTIVGAGQTPLRDTSGNPFNGGVNQSVEFTLDLGTKVTAVVPQPITRVGGLLSQNARTIEVFYDQTQLAPSSVQSPGFYRLIDTATGAITLPQSVAVVNDPVTLRQKATLTFAADIPAGTFKLEIGTTYESDATRTQARHVANSMASPLQAFIGDRIDGGIQVNDVDLYRFDLRVGAILTAAVQPAAGLDAVLRIFNSAGTQIGIQNNGGPGALETFTSPTDLPAGTYYVGVSSANNTGYNVVDGTSASNGTTTGAYSIQVQFNDAPGLNDNNSSFAEAALNAALGTLGLAGRTVNGASISPQVYTIQFPGAGDAPGERNIPFESHIQTIPGLNPDAVQGIREITYDFQLIYGFTPQGQPLSNAITEEQKQRVREVLELYGRYLGVQFREVSSSNVGTDMTIATGDPRAVAPTITTNVAPNGVNGIAGSANVPLGSITTGVQTNTTGPITGTTTFSTDDRAPIVVTSAGHGLTSGTRIEITGVQGNTNANAVWTINVIDPNTFSLIGSRPNGGYLGGGTWRVLDLARGVAIMNALVNWGNSEYGGAYFRTAMHEIGHLLGLSENFEAAALTIMGGEEVPSQAANRNNAEGVFPGDADIVYGQALHRPESRDIDLYQFVVTEAGLFRAETIAERLGGANPSLLNTVLTLYQETSGSGQATTRQIIARNDDYYGNDSYLELQLVPGTYYIGVTSVGNTEYDPTLANTGFGGRTQGAYNLKLEMKPDSGSTMVDTSGVPFDGDADNRPGGAYEFWFQSNTPATTIYVDKASVATLPSGSLAAPYNNLPAALAAASQPGTRKIVRIVGNGGADNDPATLLDNAPYLVGFKDLDQVLDQPLPDGGDFLVPQDVTVMIDAGAVFKMRKANLNAGTTPQGLVSRSGGAIQVLGTPNLAVQFTSYADDSIGGDSDGPSAGAQGGDYGGIVFREDSDREQAGVFLNYVNHATMNYGGGRVTVDSVEDTYNPVHMVGARPHVSYNRIQRSADAAMSADPNSFDDDGLRPSVTFDARRIGPDIHDNTVGSLSAAQVNLNNTVNGMFIRVKTLAGNPLDLVDLTTRWDDTDIVHVVSENLLISGTPGGSSTPDADRPTTTLTDGRLRIDPGIIVKLSGARIEATVSSQFIAEGTVENPIIFTSLKDDKYGAGGTFDTNRDGAATGPAPGQWGGLVFSAASSGSLDRASVFYGGGVVPIEGDFDRFNAIEIQQADVRIANSVLQFNDGGGSVTDRNGRGFNSNAVIFARGAQPIIIGNNIRDNSNVANNNGPAISVNANAMQETRLADYGRATGPIGLFDQFNDNHGPLIRLNRMINNSLNGMEVRGGTLTTEAVWDDTDIAHILRSEIIVPNHQVNSGLRLQSHSTESLVVKLLGSAAGFTASGRQLDIADRIGGSLYVIGQPGFPVVLTSLNDDGVPVGFNPDGLPIFDTNNNASATAPAGGDWRSVNLNQYSNDRNVAQILEREAAYVGNVDTNLTPATAQSLGSLAPNEKSGDDNRRLGFEIDATISYNRPHDIDVYSFNADSGSEVWIDTDRTSYGLDIMVELVDVNGTVLARATDTNPNLPDVSTNFQNTFDPGLISGNVQAQSFNKDHFNGRDTYTTNPRDAVMRVVLPPAANGTALKNVPYFLRVRSQPASLTGESGNTVNPGLTSGHYQLQVRLNQQDEKAGSTVKFADIRFATNGIEVHGLPYHSPLTGETVEADSAANGTQANAQFIGNLLRSDHNTLSVGGDIANIGDIDFYQFDLTFDLLEFVNGYTTGIKSWSTIFDLDYGDGLSRADATISVFDAQGRLILMGRDSDVQDDQGTAGNELTSGTFGKQDPFIGPAQLPAGNPGQRRTYFVAVTNNRQLPSVLDQSFAPTPNTPGVRLEPVDSVARAVTEHFEAFCVFNPLCTGRETAEFPENVYIPEDQSFGEPRSTLLDASNLQSINANVKPFGLGDVPLFVSDNFTLHHVDAASGQTEVFYNVLPGLPTANNTFVEDLAFRSDGLLYSYEGVSGNRNGTAGRLALVGTGTGVSTTVSNDNIPDEPANPAANTIPNPEEITTDMFGGAAMAIGGSVIPNLNSTEIFYAVPDFGQVVPPNVYCGGRPAANPPAPLPACAPGNIINDQVSRLYIASAGGEATPAAGTRRGRVRTPTPGGNNADAGQGVNDFINAAVGASASTNFGLPGNPVTVTFTSPQIGPSGNGTVINFLPPADPGFPGPPTVVVTPAAGTTPATVDITLNSNGQPVAATGASDFGTGYFANPAIGAALRLTAAAAGVAGNNIRLIFLPRTDQGGPGPIIDADPAAGTIRVTLSNTAGQATTVFDLASALNNDPVANTMVVATAEGPDANVVRPGDPGTTLPGQIVLSGGSNGGGNTAQQLVDEVNRVGGTVVRASLAGPGVNPGATVISNQVPVTDYPTPLILQGGLTSVGLTTGLALNTNTNFVGGGFGLETLYGVTDRGVFLIDINTNDLPRFIGGAINPPAAPAATRIVTLPDPFTPGVFNPAHFTALTAGPENVENGRFANMFFALATDNPNTPSFEPTRMVALDETGALQTVFDTNFDGTDDAAFVTLSGVFNPTGLAFSPFDFNLWHPTFRRQNDPGHDVGDSGTATTNHNTQGFPASGRDNSSANMSMYFGYEPWVQAVPGPGYRTSSYQQYDGNTGSGSLACATGAFLPTGNADLLPSCGQLGLIGEFSDLRQRELSNSATQGGNQTGTFANSYNMPGGAHGELITDPFNLSTLKATDKPTMYFDYFLETDDLNQPSPAFRTQRDSARVYIGPFTRVDFAGRSYVTWDLVATNNSALDNPGTGTAVNGFPDWEGELPTFLSPSVTAMPENPRQQVQLMHDNTGQWRQVRVDLSRYAGMSNLQLRFDFTTAGSMPDPNGQLPPNPNNNITRWPPNIAPADAGKEFLFENNFGDLTHFSRGQANNFEGFYVDNIIVGAAERGELVINAPADTNFFNLGAAGTNTQPRNYDPSDPLPSEVLTGPYQLEIRRGAEYGMSDGGNFSTQTPLLLLDTNERLIPDKRLGTPIPLEDFDPGFDPALRWSSKDDAGWTITDLGPAGGTTLGAGSAVGLDNGESSGLETSVLTGGGNMTFDVLLSALGPHVATVPGPFGFPTQIAVEGDFFRLYIDGRVAIDSNGVPVQYTGDVPLRNVTVPIAPGRHHIRFTYDKDEEGFSGLDRAFIDNVSFPTPQLGVHDIYDDPDLHDETDRNGVHPPPSPTVLSHNGVPQMRRLDSLYRGFTRAGDMNVHRQQGHIQIEQNKIVAAQQAGILVDAGIREAGTNNSPLGGVRNLPTLNNERLAPGLTLTNNVVANSGQVGIRFSGDANAPDAQGNLVPVAAVPFARIVNNTVYGGATPSGSGIRIDVNAGPTILNNIIANTLDGITVDPTSGANTVVGANLYAGNVSNGQLGTNSITLAASDTLFVNPSAGNFYPQAGSPAVDSSLNTLADRPSISTVKSAVGIPQSPILAPDRDLFGQLRVDEPNVFPPPGLGQNIFKDRGAVERADFTRPFATLIDPLDNDSEGRDRNPNPNDVVVRNELLRRFIIKLNDTGVDIEDFSVTSSRFTITQDGVLLSDQVDYRFVYNPVANEVIFEPTSGAWPLNHTYTIKINNSLTGVIDQAGNTLQANRATGEVLFNIFTGIVRDFGDAPDPRYPTLNASTGASHDVIPGFRLGATVSEEQDGFQSPNADGDTGDDGVVFLVAPSPGLQTTIRVNASAAGVLDAWFDLNIDGTWSANEKLISGRALVPGDNLISFSYGTPQALKGTTFARFRFTTAGITDPIGIAPNGEVEDYKIVVGGPPFQNPRNPLDVNNDTFVSPIDALLIISFMNFYSRQIGGGNIPLPPTSPPFPFPPPVIDPTGGGVPGQGRYFDVDGDGFLSPIDATLVISFLNSNPPQGQNAAAGEGESAAAFAAPSVVAAAAPLLENSGATEPSVPATLYATPSVVLEVRERSTGVRPATVIQDQALLAINPEIGPVALGSAALSGDQRTLSVSNNSDDADAGPGWDELLTDLAHDQKRLCD